MAATKMATDWDAIEAEYLAGIESIRAIAEAYNVSDTAIHKRAKKQGWVRNPAAAKRRQVSQKINSGLRDGLQEGLQKKAQTIIDNAVTEDVTDMLSGLSNARAALARINDMLIESDKPADIKTLSDANRINIEVIRTIRELDVPDGQSELERMSDEQLDRRLDQLIKRSRED